MRDGDGEVERRLAELGIELPPAHPPHGVIEPVVEHGGLAVLSGALPRDLQGDLVHPGVVGEDVTVEEGREAARWAALNCLATLRAAYGTLDAIDAVFRLRGIVTCRADFTGQAEVVDGATEVLHDVFGDRGRGARSAIGGSAPRGACIELELEVRLRPDR
ncbi:MAG: RidA family protein [Acidimicrobiales bacterium]